MGARLAYSVVLADGNVAEGGTEETPALRKAVTNPRAWVGDPDSQESGEPPRSGRGSSVEAWRDYAVVAGVEVEDDATRDDIIAAVDTAAG